jgi:TetR/AcrR family transcriptional repressor of nem operon
MARPRSFDEDAVLDAAIGGFWEFGYEATSVRDLAARMGLSGPSLYNAFGDKRALFARALARYADRSMRVRMRQLEVEHEPAEAIRRFFDSIIRRSVDDDDRRGCMIVNSALEVAPHDAELGRVIGLYLDEIRDFFLRNIRAGQRSGAVPAGLDAAETASLLLGVLLGIRVLARSRPERDLLEAVVRPALALLDPTHHRGIS